MLSAQLATPPSEEQLRVSCWFQVWMKRLMMAEYGAGTLKPTVLLSNAPWIHALPRSPCDLKSLPPSRTTHRYIDRNGKRRCTGTKQLKQTQSGAQVVARL